MSATDRLDRVLVVAATAGEAQAITADLGAGEQLMLGRHALTRTITALGEVVVLVSGVGPAAAAASTAAALSLLGRIDLVVSMGIAGGFTAAGVVTGDAVVATRIVAADLGADDDGTFLPLEQIAPGTPSALELPAAHTDALTERLMAAGLAATAGPLLTVSTVTGSASRAEELWQRHKAVGEAMEGYGVALAAAGLPVLELRTVSNPVGRRDRSAWDLPAALWALTAAAAALTCGPLPRVGP